MTHKLAIKLGSPGPKPDALLMYYGDVPNNWYILVCNLVPNNWYILVCNLVPINWYILVCIIVHINWCILVCNLVPITDSLGSQS